MTEQVKVWNTSTHTANLISSSHKDRLPVSEHHFYDEALRLNGRVNFNRRIKTLARRGSISSILRNKPMSILLPSTLEKRPFEQPTTAEKKARKHRLR